MSKPQIGDVYFTVPDHTRINVHRCARDGSWADITVTQSHGATWRKRQRLVDGEFPFEAVAVTELGSEPAGSHP